MAPLILRRKVEVFVASTAIALVDTLVTVDHSASVA